jgi:hypothetical protein
VPPDDPSGIADDDTLDELAQDYDSLREYASAFPIDRRQSAEAIVDDLRTIRDDGVDALAGAGDE